MREDESLKNLWFNYQKYNRYAETVNFESALDTVEEISRRINLAAQVEVDNSREYVTIKSR